MALHELGGRGVWLPIGLWICMGILAVLDLSARAHGDLLSPTDRQVAVTPSTPNDHASDAAVVLCGLAALGYDGIAQAIRDAQQHTGLGPHELAMRLGLPPDAVVLWAQGSFIPRTHHLLRLGQVLADHQPQPSSSPRPPTRPAAGEAHTVEPSHTPGDP